MVNIDQALGVSSSGGGLRTYYNAGLFYMLKKHRYPVVHITAASGGLIAGALPYLVSRDEKDLEEHVTALIRNQSMFSFRRRFLTPAFWNFSGGYLVEMDRSFIEDELMPYFRNQVFLENLEKIKLDISVTNVSGKVQNEIFNLNQIILDEKDDEKASQLLYATICTIPLTKAPKIDGNYYIDGGYTKNTPLWSLFHNKEVASIVLIDFTHYLKYGEGLDRCYEPNPLRLMDNFLEMQELAMQISFDACNKIQLGDALFLNNLIRETRKQELKLKSHTYVYKPIYSLKPENLEMNPLHPQALELAKNYYELGKKEAEEMLLRGEDTEQRRNGKKTSAPSEEEYTSEL